MKKIFSFIFVVFTFLFVLAYTNVKAESCTQFEFNDGGFPVASITINGQAWTSVDDRFEPNEGNYEMIILAGKKGDEFPDLSRPGGLGEKSVIPNPDATGTNDQYKITLTITNHNDGACAFIGGFSLIPGPEPTNSMNGNLTVQITGNDLEWHELSDEASHFTFAINDSEMIFLNGENLDFTKENGKIVSGRTINPISLPYNVAGDTVTLHMHTNASEYIESMTINGVSYNTPKTREELANAFYRDMLCISFDIENIPKADTYDIVINAAHLSGNDQLTGGFGWNYSADGDVDSATDRIPHGKIEFVRAEYNNVEYSSVAEFKSANRLFEWHDAIKKDHYEIGDRSQFGYTFFPTGTKVTIKIIPDAGYQLVGLRNSGQEFIREEEPGVYTFNMPGGTAALQANFVEISDTVDNKAEQINSGNISNVTFNNGTAKLEVENIGSMSPAREEEFDNAAGDYKIDNYLEISLYNTIYKGGEKDENNNYLAWNTEIHELENNATVELELKDNLNATDVAVIHEVRDEDNNIMGYDLIEANYNSSTKTISFETDGFSTYAIATKGEIESQEEVEKVKVDFDSRGGTNLSPIELVKGEKVEKPKDPSKENDTFIAWFSDEALHDEYDFNKPVDKNLVLYAKWSSDEESNHGDESDINYTVTDEDGNEIIFGDDPGKKFTLTIMDYLKISAKELEELTGGQVTKEQYDGMVNEIKNKVKDKGTLLAFYEILVTGTNEENEEYNVEKENLTIKIKATKELMKYTNLYLTFIDIDDNNNITKGESVKLSLSSDKKYYVGKLPHLSKWTLTGTINNNPQTGDNIMVYVTMFGISTLGLISSGLYLRKKSY